MTEMNGLAQALAKLQTRLPEIKKSQEAKVPTKAGGSYSYTYADLAQITRQLMPVLGELGLSFIAKPTTLDGQFVLAYKLLHASGEAEEGFYPLQASSNPQTMGGAITYARRYCLCAVTGIAPDDDDDGAAAQAEALSKQRNTSNGQRQEWRAPTASRPAPAASQDNGPVTQPQLQKMHVLFGQVEWTDKADRLRAASSVAGRELDSSKDLTRDEASRLIDVLQQAANNPDPATRLGELISATSEAGA